jgi:hypothetical protein
VLLIFGLVISIPIVVLGAQLVMKLMERFAWVIVAGGGLLGWLAGEIATHDAAVKPWIDAQMPRSIDPPGGRRRAGGSGRHVARPPKPQGAGLLSPPGRPLATLTAARYTRG